MQYSANGVCAFCQHGLYVNSLGKCQRVNVKDCHRVRANDPTRCEICREGHLVTANGTCDGDMKCAENCRFCTLNLNNVESCERCKNGYALSPNLNGTNQCVEENDQQQNCLLLNQFGRCDICDLNYYQGANDQCLESNVLNSQLIASDSTLDMDSSEESDEDKASLASIAIAIFVFLF